jgi:cysteine-rich repeat protein
MIARDFLRSFVASAIFATSFAAALGGCKDDAPEAKEVCGGITSAEGKCLAICDDAIDCKDTAKTCVRTGEQDPGHCYLKCQTTAACPEGFACGPSTFKPNGKDQPPICYDRTLGGLPAGTAGSTCETDDGCDTEHGLTCVTGKCVRPEGAACTATEQCNGSLALICDEGKCGPHRALGAACTKREQCYEAMGEACIGEKCTTLCSDAQPGSCPPGEQCQIMENLGTGACQPVPSTIPAGPGQYGSSCPQTTECAAGFTCIGIEGDIDNYCTKLDGCTTDAECPSGHWCGAIQQHDANDRIIVGGAKRACQPRLFCAPCETDFDCSVRLGSICAPDENGEKFCTFPCDIATNSCRIGAECVDVGGGINACRPDQGSCREEAPIGCSPCRTDLDCGPGGICIDGSEESLTAMNYCVVPCGPPDEFGKKTCPLAPNGVEMVCFDDNFRSWGYLTIDGSKGFSAAYEDHCWPNWVAQNLPVTPDKDPPHAACGNARRDIGEECDDGNPVITDGCGKDCKVTSACRFTVAADNADGNPKLLDGSGAEVLSIPAGCRTFFLEGDLEAPGDIDTFAASLPDGMEAFVDVFTDAIDTCTADLQLEMRGGVVDLTVPCESLVSGLYSANSAEALCGSSALPCGPCKIDGNPDYKGGYCGICDDDGGLGACPRMIAQTTTTYYQYKVKYDSVEKVFRIYAHDETASGAHYLVIYSAGDREPYHPAGTYLNVYKPTPSCFQ